MTASEASTAAFRPAGRTGRMLLAPIALLYLLGLAARISFFLVMSVFRYSALELWVPTVTGENFSRLVGDAYYRAIVLRTLRIALLTTAGSLLLGYPLAWFLARIGPRVKVSLVGYSFGGAIVTGALHGLALERAKQPLSDQPPREPCRAVLLAPAVDERVLAQGHDHSLALTQVDAPIGGSGAGTAGWTVQDVLSTWDTALTVSDTYPTVLDLVLDQREA